MINKIGVDNSAYNKKQPCFRALQGKIVEREMFSLHEGTSDFFRENTSKGLFGCLRDYFDIISPENILAALKTTSSQMAQLDQGFREFVTANNKLGQTEFCKAFGEFLQGKGIVDKNNIFQAFPARCIRIIKGNDTISSDFRTIATSVQAEGVKFDDELVIGHQIWLYDIDNPNLDLDAHEIIAVNSRLGRLKVKDDINACWLEARSIESDKSVKIDRAQRDDGEMSVQNRVHEHIKAKDCAELEGIEADTVSADTVILKGSENNVGTVRAYVTAIIDQVRAKRLIAPDVFIAPAGKRGPIHISRIEGCHPRDLLKSISQANACTLSGYRRVPQKTKSLNYD